MPSERDVTGSRWFAVFLLCALVAAGCGRGDGTLLVSDKAGLLSVIQKQPGLPRALALDLGGRVGMELVLIPAGEFMMGSRDSAEDVARKAFAEIFPRIPAPYAEEKKFLAWEHPRHRVRITRPFYMGRYEVTQRQYKWIMRKNPSRFRGSRKPVEQMTWDDVMEFCRRLSQRTGLEVRLPTEAEWEYACRAGTTTPFHFGERINRRLANSNCDYPLKASAWRGGPWSTTRVGRYPPNAWGLHDMHGNVAEWCSDCFSDSYYEGSPVEDPAGPSTGDLHPVRGGSWHDTVNGRCRSASRHGNGLLCQSDGIGFRVVVSVPAGLTETPAMAPAPITEDVAGDEAPPVGEEKRRRAQGLLEQLTP